MQKSNSKTRKLYKQTRYYINNEHLTLLMSHNYVALTKNFLKSCK